MWAAVPAWFRSPWRRPSRPRLVAGLDFDARSIDIARGHARSAGLAHRVAFLAESVDALPTEPGWDFISTFDVIHDLPDPVGAMTRIRSALNEGGTYLMVEPKVADRLETNVKNPFARMLYGISCLHCVPQSLAQGGPGLGACWGEDRARRWQKKPASRGSSVSTSAALRWPSMRSDRLPSERREGWSDRSAQHVGVAAHRQRLPGDRAPARARDEHHQVGELLRRHVLLERREGERELLHLLEGNAARLRLGRRARAAGARRRRCPGSSALTRMPSSPSSIASDRVSPITPHLAAA